MYQFWCYLWLTCFLVLGKYWSQWFWIFSCPRKNIWHEIWPLHSDKKNSYFLVRSLGPDLLKHLVFRLRFFQLFSFSFYPPLPLFQLLVFQNCFFISFWGKLIFVSFLVIKFLSFEIFLDFRILRQSLRYVSTERTKLFE